MILLSASCYAAEIRGTVVDSKTKEPLIGATVQVAGTNLGTATDIDGNFVVNVEGEKELIIKYVSYRDKTVSTSEATEGWIIALDADNNVLGEVTITAKAKQDSEATVVAKTKNSTTVQSGVSSQQIQKTQDKDASEVIKRIPGISIIDDKFVMVRGLSQRYNNVWVNGSAVPSSEADFRAFSFDIIPSSQLDNIMIVKSPAPEYPADFSGGFILVNTKNMPTENSYSVSIGGNINSSTHFKNFTTIKGSATDFLGFDNGFRNHSGGINGKLNPLGSGINLQGNGFNNDWSVKTTTPYSDFSLSANVARTKDFAEGDKFGLIGAVNYSNSYRTQTGMINNLFGAYDVENDKSNYLRNSVDNQYTNDVRVGALLNLTYISANGKNRFEFKNILNQLGKDRYTDRSGVNAQSDREQSAEYFYSSRTTYNGQFTGEHTIDETNYLDWSAGYAYANRNMPDRRRYVVTDALQPNHLGLVTGNDINREYTFLNENIASAAANYKHEFTFGEIKPTLRVGAYGEYRTRSYRTRSYIYTWDPANNNLPDDFRYMDMTELLSNEAYFGEDGLSLLEEVKWRNNYDGNNTLLAGYAAANIPLGKFNIHAGVRFEHNRMELISNSRDYEQSPTSTFYNYNDLFPSINTTYRFNEKHQLRLAYGQSVNRPEFREVSSSVYYDFDLASSVQGNPDLTSCYIHNADLRYEYYPSNGEMITIAAFYKHFKNPIEWTYTVAGGTDLIYSYKNAEGATSYGMELDIKKNLGFMGLDDFSLIFNGSIIKSNVDFAEGDQEADRPMQGQSPYLINTGLFYQNDRIRFSGSLLYNRIGKRLVGVGRSIGTTQDDIVTIPDSYEMPRNTIDLNLSQKVGKYVEVKLSIKDILAEPVCFKQFDTVRLNNGQMKDVEEITRKYYPGRNFNLSVSLKF